MSNITAEKVQALIPEYPLTECEIGDHFFRCTFTNGKGGEDHRAVMAQFQIDEEEKKNITHISWEDLALARLQRQLQYYIDINWLGKDPVADLIKEAEELLKGD